MIRVQIAKREVISRYIIGFSKPGAIGQAVSTAFRCQRPDPLNDLDRVSVIMSLACLKKQMR